MMPRTMIQTLFVATLTQAAGAQTDPFTCEPPRLLGVLTAIDHPVSLTIDGDYAYIAQQDDSFLIVDISNPYNPTLLADTDDLPLQFSDETVITINGDAAYINGSTINIEDKTDPWFMRYYAVSRPIFGDYIYALDNNSSLTAIFNVSRPFAPAIDDGAYPLDLDGGNPIAQINDQMFTDKLDRIDISDPLNPFLIEDNSFQPPYTIERSRYDEPYIILQGDPGDNAIVHTYNQTTDSFTTIELEGISSADLTVRGGIVYSVLEGLNIHTLSESPLHIGTYTDLPGIDGARYIRRHNEHFVILSDDTLAIYDIPTNPNSGVQTGLQLEHLEIMGSTAILSTGNIDSPTQGASVIDISDPTQPRSIAQLPTPNAFGIETSAPYVFVADKDSGLQVFDLSNPAQPLLIETYNTSVNQAGTPNTRDVFISGDYLYAADRNAGLSTYAISNGHQLQHLATLPFTQALQRITVQGNLAFASGLNALFIVDVSNPDSPTILSSIAELPGTTNYIYTAKRQGNLLYTADSNNGYRIFDISDPSSPFQLAHFDADVTTSQGSFEAFVYDFIFEQNHLYVAMSWTGFAVYDNTDPFDPILLRHAPAALPAQNNLARYRDLEIQGNLLFTSAGAAGLRVYDLSDCALPCAIDFNTDGALNFFDVAIFIQAYLDEDPLADLNNDNAFNFFDVASFLVLYNEGCP